MSEQLTIEHGDTKYEQGEVDVRFQEIIQDIEIATSTLTNPEREVLDNSPQMKPAGTMDQGYRHG